MLWCSMQLYSELRWLGCKWSWQRPKKSWQNVTQLLGHVMLAVLSNASWISSSKQ